MAESPIPYCPRGKRGEKVSLVAGVLTWAGREGESEVCVAASRSDFVLKIPIASSRKAAPLEAFVKAREGKIRLVGFTGH